MKICKWFMMVVLLLGFMMVLAVPKDAMAEKSLGITKKAYLKAYNEQLSRLFGLKFEKLGETEIEEAYYLTNANGKALLALRNKPGNPKQLTEVVIYIIYKEDDIRSEKNGIVTMNLGIAYAVEPNPTTNTLNLFTKKYQDKVDQGLNEFSYEMGDKLIKVNIKKDKSVKTIGITITPL